MTLNEQITARTSLNVGGMGSKILRVDPTRTKGEVYCGETETLPNHVALFLDLLRSLLWRDRDTSQLSEEMVVQAAKSTVERQRHFPTQG